MAPIAKPLVVLAGPIHPDGHTLLETEARVTVCPDLTEDGVIAAARAAEGILFRIRPNCSERLMSACKQLKVIGRHGVGLDTVDLPAATRLGIPVVHAPGSNSDAVAEHAVMLMLGAAKKTLAIDRATRKGEWVERRALGIFELKGKTLGVIGVGNIGRRVAHIARAFGMRVLGCDPYVTSDCARSWSSETGSVSRLRSSSGATYGSQPSTRMPNELRRRETE